MQGENAMNVPAILFLQRQRYLLYLASLFFMSSALNAHDLYYQEFKAFTAMPDYKIIFDKDAHQGMSGIQQDIENCKALSPFQRLVRSIFFTLDVVVITPETMPLLYSYVDTMCKKHALKTPTIFITRKKNIFNAMAQKLLISSGAIVIGQKLLKELSDQELEAVVAHEIGHIRYNHVNKGIAICIASHYACIKLLQHMMPDSGHPMLSFISGSLLASLIINKRFEKEADKFAYKEMGKGAGLIGFFECIQEKTCQREQDFISTCACLEHSKQRIYFIDYLKLKGYYYWEKLGQSLLDGYKWIYYNTFYGPHPSPEARIETIKEYLDTTKL
jgi:Zn-dependent protease with chaperone function